MTPHRTLIALNLKRLRTDQGLTRTALARRCTDAGTPIGAQTLRAYEQAHTSPTLDRLATLATALRVPLVDLLSATPTTRRPGGDLAQLVPLQDHPARIAKIAAEARRAGVSDRHTIASVRGVFAVALEREQDRDPIDISMLTGVVLGIDMALAALDPRR